MQLHVIVHCILPNPIMNDVPCIQVLKVNVFIQVPICVCVYVYHAEF